MVAASLARLRAERGADVKYALMIGRWQPFHDGHEALVRHVLDQGRNVCIAIRDTPRSETDPDTIATRMLNILRHFRVEIAEDRVRVIVVPDIEAVVYGRDVGYGIEEIALDADTEAISGTQIRAGAA